MSTYFAGLKAPFIAALRQIPGVKIVNRLPSTSRFIVSGPASEFAEKSRDLDFVLNSKCLLVDSNLLSVTAPAQVGASFEPKTRETIS